MVHMSQVATQAAAYASFSCMERLRVVLPLPGYADGVVIHHRVTFKDVRATIVHSIDFFLNFYCSDNDLLVPEMREK